MNTNQRQIALSVLEALREDLTYAHLNNGSRVVDVADLRQYIYEQMGRLGQVPYSPFNTRAIVMRENLETVGRHCQAKYTRFRPDMRTIRICQWKYTSTQQQGNAWRSKVGCY